MSYWTDRQEQLKQSAEKSESALKKRLEKFYDAEFKRLDKEIAAYYQTYGYDNVIEYRRLLQSLSEEDRTLLMERMDDFAKKYPQYANLMPVRESIYRLDRLQGLQYSVFMTEAEIAGYTNEQMETYLRRLSQQGLNYGMETLGFGKNFYSVNDDIVRQFVDVPWCNGENFSTRIWNDTNRLAQYLNQDIAQGFARGDSYDKLVRNLRQRFRNVNRKNAYRLVFTEGTYVMAESSMQPFIQDFDKYHTSPVLDGRTCSICRGMRHEVFLISDRQPGVNFPPFHPWCRCSFEIVVDDWNKWMDDYVAKHSGDRKQAKKIKNRLDTGQNDDIIKESKYQPVKTIEEAIEYLRELGISTSYDYKKSVNLDVANMINKEITDMYDQFGNLHDMGVLDEIFIVTGKKSWYAAYQRQTGMLMLSKSNVSRKTAISKLAKDAKDNKDIGFWSTGAAEHSIRHELGHAVDYALVRDKGIINNPKADKITALNNKVTEECGISRWSTGDREHFKAAGDKLSYYGLMNDKEFVAESVAEYMNGNPRDTAKAVIDILMDRG